MKQRLIPTTLATLAITSGTYNLAQSDQTNFAKEDKSQIEAVINTKIPLQIKERVIGSIVVLDLNGSITTGNNADLLRTKIRKLLVDNKTKILVNFDKVSQIDSRGIGELVSSFAAVNKACGEMKILNLTQRLKDLLAITKLLTIFDVYDNEQKAITSFSKVWPVIDNNKQSDFSKNIEKKVKRILADELGFAEGCITPSAHLVNDLRADSLDEVEIIMRFEDEFSIEIPDEDAVEIKTVKDIYDYLGKHLEKKP